MFSSPIFVYEKQPNGLAQLTPIIAGQDYVEPLFCQIATANSHRDAFANDKQDAISWLFLNIFIAQFYNTWAKHFWSDKFQL